jgi:hypothetical protein
MTDTMSVMLQNIPYENPWLEMNWEQDGDIFTITFG